MVIFISGSINAGKTTVGKLLAERLGYEFIDFDDLHEVVAGSDFSLKRDLPKVFDEGIKRLNDLEAQGKSIVVAYVIREEDHKRIQKGLHATSKFVTLAPEQAVARTNRGGRELSDWELGRIDYHYDTGIANPKFGVVIDNTALTPQATATKIIRRLALSAPQA